MVDEVPGIIGSWHANITKTKHRLRESSELRGAEKTERETEKIDGYKQTKKLDIASRKNLARRYGHKQQRNIINMVRMYTRRHRFDVFLTICCRIR